MNRHTEAPSEYDTLFNLDFQIHEPTAQNIYGETIDEVINPVPLPECNTYFWQKRSVRKFLRGWYSVRVHNRHLILKHRDDFFWTWFFHNFSQYPPEDSALWDH
jgi:hypothetical protein